MNTFEAIETRRSVKHYDPTHKMTQTEVDKLLSLAILSPTAFNIQHWRFVVIDQPELRAKVREAAWGQAQVTDASLLLAVVGDLNAWNRQPERYFSNTPADVAKAMIPMIQNAYANQPEKARDEVMRSCAFAAQTIMLAARDMGYDSCSMGGFDPVKVGELIHLPEDHVISMLLVVGKAAQPARPRSGQLPLNEVVIHNTF